jgi:Na+-transporting NADH:ubiquinone oxidoreductase subunit C
MGINKDSNAYTVIFATAMVVIVGGLLAFVSTSLKPLQEDNVRNEKKQLILKAIGSDETNSISREAAGTEFQKYVVERLILDYEGNIIEGTKLTNETAVDIKNKKDAFAVDLKKEYKKFVQPLTNKFQGDELKSELMKETDIHYPLFICTVNDKRHFVIPVMGKGLWAGVWGYIGLEEDGKTISGAAFDHKSETPGLGAEISKDFFSNQFIGLKIIDDAGEFTPIKVVKPGTVVPGPYVDGISGGTFTSVGVDEMMKRTLVVYHKFFQNEEGKELLTKI